MYTLYYSHKIDAAHHLPNYEGKCKNLHGHSWEIELRIEKGNLNSSGMIIDFTILKSILDRLDHKYINDVIDNPTAENISKWIFDVIKAETKLEAMVTVWESDNAAIIYEE